LSGGFGEPLPLEHRNTRRCPATDQYQPAGIAHRDTYPPQSQPVGDLVKAVKMMDRPVAMADTEAIGRRDRGADPGLGLANGGFQILAFGKAGGDRG